MSWEALQTDSPSFGPIDFCESEIPSLVSIVWAVFRRQDVAGDCGRPCRNLRRDSWHFGFKSNINLKCFVFYWIFLVLNAISRYVSFLSYFFLYLDQSFSYVLILFHSLLTCFLMPLSLKAWPLQLGVQLLKWHFLYFFLVSPNQRSGWKNGYFDLEATYLRSKFNQPSLL